MTTRRRYTLSQADAKQQIEKVADLIGVKAYISDNLMMASATGSYRLTFRDGGATAWKSSRTERWFVQLGIG